jgi:hypothetical protein
MESGTSMTSTMAIDVENEVDDHKLDKNDVYASGERRVKPIPA